MVNFRITRILSHSLTALLILLGATLPATAQSETYPVGQSVVDTLFKAEGPFEIPYCESDSNSANVSISSELDGNVTGMEYKVLIDSVVGTPIDGSGEFLQKGQVLDFSIGGDVASRKLKVGPADKLFWYYRYEGTPSVEGETYTCQYQEVTTLLTCNNSLSLQPISDASTCTIQSEEYPVEDLKQGEYRVGDSVIDTLVTPESEFVRSSLNPCPFPTNYTRTFSVAPELSEYITGLSFEVVIDSVKGVALDQNYDTLRVGESFPITTEGTEPNGITNVVSDHISYHIRLAGTPSSVGEGYACELEAVVDQGGCQDHVTIQKKEGSATCYVGRSNSIAPEEGDDLPRQTQLAQNYPNPFNPSTTISFSLRSQGEVELSVYNLSGQLVASLVDERRSAGTYAELFDASQLNSGVYVYRLSVDGVEVASRKMVLVK